MHNNNVVTSDVLKAAISLFEGNEADALNWLNQPAIALGGVKPVDADPADVIRLVRQIELGIYP